MTQIPPSIRQLAEETAAKWTNEHVEQLAPLIESALLTLAAGYEERIKTLERERNHFEELMHAAVEDYNDALALTRQIREEDARIADECAAFVVSTGVVSSLLNTETDVSRGGRYTAEAIAKAIRARQEK
jgi:hypothetical protein